MNLDGLMAGSDQSLTSESLTGKFIRCHQLNMLLGRQGFPFKRNPFHGDIHSFSRVCNSWLDFGGCHEIMATGQDPLALHELSSDGVLASQDHMKHHSNTQISMSMSSFFGVPNITNLRA